MYINTNINNLYRPITLAVVFGFITNEVFRFSIFAGILMGVASVFLAMQDIKKLGDNN
ncbi:hypothetical protein KY314_04640 [Candidatus Woesearchaeota archaeon]|nr:hypothetical protein [Candidatus Woesearchaeota archaeon]